MSLLSRILVLGSAMVIALPPGWCCLGFRVAAAEYTPAEAVPQPKSCCHTEPEPVAADEPAGQAPSAPALSCCCRDEAAVRSDQKVVADGPTLAAPLVPPAVDWAGPLTSSHTDHLTPLALASLLQVLHCVWLC
jgi:hypothetical protein